MTPSKTSVKINQYWKVSAQDYHEFTHIQSIYDASGIKTKYEPIGYERGFVIKTKYENLVYNRIYYAIFWIGKKPIKVITEAKKTFVDNKL